MYGYKCQIRSLSGVIKRLKYHRNIHLGYIYNPKWCKGNSGSVEHHKKAVVAYQAMIDYLKSLKKAETK